MSSCLRQRLLSSLVLLLALVIPVAIPKTTFGQITAMDFLNNGVAKDKNGNVDGAISDFSHAIEQNPKYSLAYLDRGIARLKKNDNEGAIADFSRAIELDPNDVRFYNERGIARRNKGDLDGAIADYTRAIELEPKNFKAFNNRGLAKRAKEDVDGAIADFGRAIELDSKGISAYNNRGFARRAKGDTDGAIADYGRIIALDPKSVRAYRGCGSIYFLERNWTKALIEFQHACDLDFNNEDYSQFYLWIIHARLGERDKASSDLTAYMAARVAGKPGDWPSTVASFLLDKITEKDFLAAADNKDARTDAGQHCEAWFFMGIKRLLAKDSAVATDDFRKCLATGANDFDEYQFAEAELKALSK